VQSLRTSDGNPIRETVVCDEHTEFIDQLTESWDSVDEHEAGWDRNEAYRVDEVTANRQGLRCQICGSQECDPAD
jgi:hypothetical protein